MTVSLIVENDNSVPWILAAMDLESVHGELDLLAMQVYSLNLRCVASRKMYIPSVF